ncbi:vgr related protein [Sphingosinithalassobacter portus]|uniref:vgr related protein n=1 Tax=Stakelama portus TaxID=2676234 RepID=UPI000D6DE859|nr:vgr related protein [Sphingosinithalassobacter portus]
MGRAKRRSERRALTPGEIALARSIFGDAIDYDRAKIINRKWAFFQPKNVTMAPLGTIHFNPASGLYRDDFSDAPLYLQGLFIHEMVHVWQHQQGMFLPIARHPFCRYDYSIDPGRPFERYGIEQQAEIVRHAFLKRRGAAVPDKHSYADQEVTLPF